MAYWVPRMLCLTATLGLSITSTLGRRRHRPLLRAVQRPVISGQKGGPGRPAGSNATHASSGRRLPEAPDLGAPASPWVQERAPPGGGRWPGGGCRGASCACALLWEGASGCAGRSGPALPACPTSMSPAPLCSPMPGPGPASHASPISSSRSGSSAPSAPHRWAPRAAHCLPAAHPPPPAAAALPARQCLPPMAAPADLARCPLGPSPAPCG